MARYTISEVKIDGSYPVNEILELYMDIGVNRHGLLTYGGLISEEEAKQYIQQSADKQVIYVYLRGELEFCGYLHTIATEHHNDHCYFRATLVTSSQLMDTVPCDRFFQDVNYTFADMLTESYEDSGIGNLVAIRGKDQILSPLLQYHETDWQYTLRIAGKLRSVIIPNVTSAEPQITLGIPNRKVNDETNKNDYSICRNIAEFRCKYSTSIRFDFQNFLCYKMKSNNRYKLGDSVKIDGKVFSVMKKNFAYEQGQIEEIYILGHEQEFAVPFHHNKRIAGLELEGKVLRRQSQDIKMLLDIDARRKDCGKTWFSYSPVTNNGMYSMPLEDEKVLLQWQSEVDNDVLVVRPERKNSHDTQPPAEQHFQTDCENHLMMVSGKIEYTNPVGNFKWLSSRGFEVSTGKNVEISAGRDVFITSQAQVDVASPERITAKKIDLEKVSDDSFTKTYKTKSSIDIFSNTLHIKAANNVKAVSKANKYKKTTLPERTQSFTVTDSVASKLQAGVSMRFN